MPKRNESKHGLGRPTRASTMRARGAEKLGLNREHKHDTRLRKLQAVWARQMTQAIAATQAEVAGAPAAVAIDPAQLEAEAEALALEVRRNRRPKTVAGEEVFEGTRLDFEADYRRQFWLKYPRPVACPFCKKPITDQGAGDQAKSIDHIEDWASRRGEIATETVCFDGVHWTVYLKRAVLDLYQEDDNLQPMHKGCNSSKNGSRTTDPLVSVRLDRAACAGAKCALRKAAD